MKRRGFLKLLGIGGPAVVVASQLPAEAKTPTQVLEELPQELKVNDDDYLTFGASYVGTMTAVGMDFMPATWQPAKRVRSARKSRARTKLVRTVKTEEIG